MGYYNCWDPYYRIGTREFRKRCCINTNKAVSLQKDMDAVDEALQDKGISQSEELKLINDYNAYTLGLITDPMVVDRYKSYIGWRANLKTKIDTLCASNNIK